MFKKLLTLAAGAVTAVVTACGDAPRVTTRYMDPTGTWDEMTGAAARGRFLEASSTPPGVTIRRWRRSSLTIWPAR